MYLFDARELGDELLHLLRDLRSDRAAGAGQRVGDPDHAVFYLDVVDETKLDEIETQLGVDHVAKCVGYVFYGGHIKSVYENRFASLPVMARFR